MTPKSLEHGPKRNSRAAQQRDAGTNTIVTRDTRMHPVRRSDWPDGGQAGGRSGQVEDDSKVPDLYFTQQRAPRYRSPSTPER